jgi:hypothetical protein
MNYEPKNKLKAGLLQNLEAPILLPEYDFFPSQYHNRGAT